MGKYAKIADYSLLDDKLVYLSTDTADAASEPDADVLNKAIEDAEAEVDSYISVRYTLPLKLNTPRFLTLITIHLAEYLLWNWKKQSAPAGTINNYNMSLEKLEKIGRGIINLGADSKNEEKAVGMTTVPFGRG